MLSHSWAQHPLTLMSLFKVMLSWLSFLFRFTLSWTYLSAFNLPAQLRQARGMLLANTCTNLALPNQWDLRPKPLVTNRVYLFKFLSMFCILLFRIYSSNCEIIDYLGWASIFLFSYPKEVSIPRLILETEPKVTPHHTIPCLVTTPIRDIAKHLRNTLFNLFPILEKRFRDPHDVGF